MDDWDFYCLAACITGLAIMGILQSRIMRDQGAMIAKLREDVDFLKIVSHETETS